MRTYSYAVALKIVPNDTMCFTLANLDMVVLGCLMDAKTSDGQTTLASLKLNNETTKYVF